MAEENNWRPIDEEPNGGKKKGADKAAKKASKKAAKTEGGSPMDGLKKFGKGVLIAFCVIFVLIFVSSCWFTLSVNEVAVLNTLGKIESVTTPGVHLKIPFIQGYYKMTKEIQGMRIGYNENDETVAEEAEMITADFNFVNVDFYIEYQVSDPVQYYIHRDTAYEILRNLAQSYIRDTVGVYNVDDVITTGRSEIQSTIKEKLTMRIEDEDIGLSVTNVTIQDAEPPTAEVMEAFRAVEDAKQSMDTKVNQANEYKSKQIPAANAEADKLIQDAEAFKQERISEATGQVARFNDMYAEYQKYPLITKKRMFYETMEDVLPDLKVIINSDEGVQTMLPLESFGDVTVNETPAQQEEE